MISGPGPHINPLLPGAPFYTPKILGFLMFSEGTKKETPGSKSLKQRLVKDVVHTGCKICMKTKMKVSL